MLEPRPSCASKCKMLVDLVQRRCDSTIWPKCTLNFSTAHGVLHAWSIVWFDRGPYIYRVISFEHQLLAFCGT